MFYCIFYFFCSDIQQQIYQYKLRCSMFNHALVFITFIDVIVILSAHTACNHTKIPTST